MEFIYTIEGLRKTYGQRVLLDGINLSFLTGAKIGVIGSNGSGKSTFLRILAGDDKVFEGTVRPAEGIRIGYVPQEPQLDPTKDVRGNLEEAVASTRALLTRHDELNEKLGTDLDETAMQKTLDELGHVLTEIEHRNAWELDRELDKASHALQLPPPDSDVTKLSGGEKRRVALCKVLMAHPDLLLLDEPTNHLDAETVEWLEHFLAGYPGTVILVTHDRYFLDNVVGWMLEIERGRGIPYKGNYSSYLEQKETRLLVEDKQRVTRSRLITRELAWIRTNPKARTSKNKARLANYERLVAEEIEAQDGPVELQIPPGPRLGDRVLRTRDLVKAYDPDRPCG
jgi:ATPase subunit of ABC transporter with duplicated ATPase domains